MTIFLFIKESADQAIRQAIPEDVNSLSRRWIRWSVDAKVTAIVFIDVDGIILTNAVLHYLITDATGSVFVSTWRQIYQVPNINAAAATVYHLAAADAARLRCLWNRQL